MKLKTNLAIATLVYTFVFIAWHNDQVQAKPVDEIQLGDTVMTQEVITNLHKIEDRNIDNTKIGDLDLICVTRGVNVAETGNCRTGSALTHNNCGGIMRWWYEDGKRMRGYVHYDNFQQSFDATYSLLKRKYSHLTIAEAAPIYSGNDRSDNWERKVKKTYLKCVN